MSPGDTVRVLVAEDSALTRTMLSNALASMDHECLVAADGDEAWRVFQASGADVIISDRLMPGLDGLELCRRVREHPGAPYTYFVFLTALTPRSEILEGMHEGADDYLTKPLDLDELRARLIAAERVTSLHRKLGEQAQALERSNQALFEIARTDPLTGLDNRLLMAETLKSLQARADRYGGEELLVVLPEQTLDSAALAGERLRRAVA